MDEVWQEQQERENESGADLAECYEWHEKNRMLLSGFDKIRSIIKPVQPVSCKPIAQRNCANPF